MNAGENCACVDAALTYMTLSTLTLPCLLSLSFFLLFPPPFLLPRRASLKGPANSRRSRSHGSLKDIPT